MIVVSAVIADCTRNGPGYEWHLTDVRRLKRPRKLKPGVMTQPV